MGLTGFKVGVERPVGQGFKAPSPVLPLETARPPP